MAKRYNTIIIDTGTFSTKAGFSSQPDPQVEIQSLVPKINPTDVMGPRGGVQVMHRGIVTNFKSLVDLWSHIVYDKLGVISPGEFAMYFTEKPLTPKANKEKTLQILFEEFQFAAVSFENNILCSLIGCGMLNGTMLDLGGGTTAVTPVYDGCVLPHAAQRLTVAGDDITEYLMRTLNQSDKFTPVSYDTARNIKETLSYISQDPYKENSVPCNYTLPDGSVVVIGEERYRCTESLFSPSLLGQEDTGLHHVIARAFKILESGEYLKSSFTNLVFSGGTSMLPGLQQRLRRELTSLGRAATYTILPNRKYLCWYGASVLASHSCFFKFSNTYTSEEYEESGPSIVHKKIY